MPESAILQIISAGAAQFLFANRQDGGLWLCVGYGVLIKARVKKGFPFKLISEMLVWLCGAWITVKLDLTNANCLFQIEDCNGYNIAFGTRYGQFDYRVIPHGLMNSTATLWLSYKQI